MPYTITGFDSAGVEHTYQMTDAGAVSGDDALLGDVFTSYPLEPFEGATPTDAELDAVRQNASRLLTYVTIAAELPLAEPPPEGTPLVPAPGVRYTAAELNAMTVAEVRELATAAHVLGAASMTKAELVAALLAQQGT
jgi:Rho termination factor, N-terminal domain